MQGLAHTFGAARLPQAAPQPPWPRGFALRVVPRRPQPLAAAIRCLRGGRAAAAAAPVPARLPAPAGCASRAPRLRCRLRPASPPCARLLAAPLGRPPPRRLPRLRASADEEAEEEEEEEAWGEEEEGEEGEEYEEYEEGEEGEEEALSEEEAEEIAAWEERRAAELAVEEAEFVELQKLQPTDEDLFAEMAAKEEEAAAALKQLEEYAATADPAQLFAEAMMTAFPVPLLQMAERYNAQDGEAGGEEEAAWKKRASEANDQLMERLQQYKDKIDARHKREEKTVQQYFEELDEDADLMDDEFYQIQLRGKLLRLMEDGKGDKVIKPKMPKQAKVLLDAIDSGDPSALLKVLLGQTEAQQGTAPKVRPRRKRALPPSDDDADDDNATPDFDAEADARGRAGDDEADEEAAETFDGFEDDGDENEWDEDDEEDEDEVEFEEGDDDEPDADEAGEEQEEREDGAEAAFDDEPADWDEETDEAEAAAQEAEMQRVLAAADVAAQADADVDEEADEEGEEERDDEAEPAAADAAGEPGSEALGEPPKPRKKRPWSPMYGRELWWVLERTRWTGFKIYGMNESDVPGFPDPILIRGVTETLEHDSTNEIFFCFEKNPRIALAVAAIALQVFECAAVVIQDFDNSQAEWRAQEQPGPILLVKDVHEAFLDFTKTFYEDPSASMTCLGICGNVGTTTKAHLIQAVMQSTGQVSGLMTPLGYEVGPTPIPPTLPPEFKEDVRTTKRKPGMRRNKALIIPKWPKPKRLSRRGDIFVPRLAGALMKEEKRWTTTPYFLSVYKGKYTRPGIKPLRPLEMTRVLAGFVAQGAESATIELTPLNCALGMADHTRFDVLVFTGLAREGDEESQDIMAARREAALKEIPPEEVAKRMADAAKIDEAAENMRKAAREQAAKEGVDDPDKYFSEEEYQAAKEAARAVVQDLEEEQRHRASLRARVESWKTRDGEGPVGPIREHLRPPKLDEAELAELPEEDEGPDLGYYGAGPDELPEEFIPLIPARGSGFRSWSDYREAVAAVFRTQSDLEQQRAVINMDDPEAEYIRDSIGGAKVVTYVGDVQEDLSFLRSPENEAEDERHEEYCDIVNALPEEEYQAWMPLDKALHDALLAEAEARGSTADEEPKAASKKKEVVPDVEEEEEQEPPFPPLHLLPQLPAWFLDLNLTREEFIGPADYHPADVYPLSIEVCIWDTKVLFDTPLGEVEIRSCLLGRDSVSDLAAAVAVGIATGVPLESIKEALENFRGVPGMMLAVDEGQPFAVVVDKARTPQQIRKAITTMRDLGAQNVITVVGAKWFTSKKERFQIGRLVHHFSDTVIITNDDPNTENEFKILNEVASGFVDDVLNSRELQYREPPMPNFNFMRDWADIALDANHERETDPWLAVQWQSYAKRYVIAERFHAIRAALGFANDGDAVLLLGKGEQDYQVVGAAKWWFDDWCEATDALRVLGSPSMANLKLDMKQLPYRMLGGKRRERKGVGGMTEAVRGSSGKAECVPAYLYEDYDAYPEEHNYMDRLMEQDDEIYGVDRWVEAEELGRAKTADEDYKPVITEEMLKAYARERAGLPPEESDADGEAEEGGSGEESDGEDDTVAAADDDDDDDDEDDDDDDDSSDEDEKPRSRAPRKAR